MLKSAIQYLTDAFPEKNKQLRKINIPIPMYLADVAMDAEMYKTAGRESQIRFPVRCLHFFPCEKI